MQQKRYTGGIICIPGRRRRLQGSEVCLCEKGTAPARSPSLSEFEALLGPRVEQQGFVLICGLSSRLVTSMPSNQPSEMPSGSPSACTADLENEFNSEIIVYVDPDQADSDTVSSWASQLGAAVRAAYNDLVQVRYTICDHWYRNMTSVALIDVDVRKRNLRETNSDQWPTQHHQSSLPASGRNLQNNDESGYNLRYLITGQCESCEEDSKFLDSVMSESMLSRARALSSSFMNPDALLDIIEVRNIVCSSDVVQFEEVVIVEFVSSCQEDESLGFDDEQISSIEEAFVSTYNRMSSQYCDEHFTTIVSVRVRDVGTETLGGNLPIEIEVFAECLGCDPQQASIYGTPAAAVEQAVLNDSNNNRELQESKPHSQLYGVRMLQDPESCVCSAQAVADRPPSESEFIEAFRDDVENLQLDCVAGVGDCQFGSIFNTDIVLSFEGNQTALTDAVRQSIQETFRELLNDLYEPDDDVCNPEFRVILDVALVPDFTLNGEFIASGANSTSNDVSTRYLSISENDDGRRKLISDSSPSHATLSPSFSPTTAFVVGSTPETPNPSTVPSEAPSKAFGGHLVRTLLTVSGVCNGCTNELFLSNQVFGGGRYLQDLRDDHIFENVLEHRNVQDQSDAASQCFCPLNAVVNLMPPSSEEVQGELSLRLEEQDIDLVVQQIDQVSAIACDDIDQTTGFASEFTISFSAAASVSDLEIQQFGDTIASVYNSLVEDYCDPLIRREVLLELVDRIRLIALIPMSPLSMGSRNLQEGNINLEDGDDPVCVNFEAKFLVHGLCRGCTDGTPLLDNANRNLENSLEMQNRILSSGKSSSSTRRRQLENDDEECFCDSSTIAPRAPSLDELWILLDTQLGGLSGVCGQPVDCDPLSFSSQFSETTILALVFEPGTVLSESQMFELEIAFLSAYNNLQDAMRSDKCGGHFRQIVTASVTADRPVELFGGGRRLSLQSIVYKTDGGCIRDCRKGDDFDVKTGVAEAIVRDVSFVNSYLAIDEFLTAVPSSIPSQRPSTSPSTAPSVSPSSSPSIAPSTQPSTFPSRSPSTFPSSSPSLLPSHIPSNFPSTSPSFFPTSMPSNIPSANPSSNPSTAAPTVTSPPTSIKDAAVALLSKYFPDGLPDTKEQEDALAWLVSSDDGLIADGDAPHLLDRFVLAIFHFATNGDGWDDDSNWLSAKRVCSWNGVGCNGIGNFRVRDLFLCTYRFKTSHFELAM